MRRWSVNRLSSSTNRKQNLKQPSEICVHLRPHPFNFIDTNRNVVNRNIRPVMQNVQSEGRGGVPSVPSAEPIGSALVRRPSLAPAVVPVAIDMTQVVGKQVITRSTGRDLGVVASMWVDPNRGEVVSLDLEDKKSGGLAGSVLATGGNARGGGGGMMTNIALGRLVQIGDVVLVQDEQVCVCVCLCVCVCVSAPMMGSIHAGAISLQVRSHGLIA